MLLFELFVLDHASCNLLKYASSLASQNYWLSYPAGRVGAQNRGLQVPQYGSKAIEGPLYICLDKPEVCGYGQPSAVNSSVLFAVCDEHGLGQRYRSVINVGMFHQSEKVNLKSASLVNVFSKDTSFQTFEDSSALANLTLLNQIGYVTMLDNEFCWDRSRQ